MHGTANSVFKFHSKAATPADLSTFAVLLEREPESRRRHFVNYFGLLLNTKFFRIYMSIFAFNYGCFSTKYTILMKIQ